VGVDIGGTFTDCVVVDEQGAIIAAKAHTTPENPADGFFHALEQAGKVMHRSLDELLAGSRLVVHATTVGTNALVTRRGAKVGLLATAGHGEAILHMRGGGRTKGLAVDQLLNLPDTDKPAPLVPRSLIREVSERVDVKGQVVVRLCEEDAERAVRALLEQGVEAIAISFLWSFMNDAHERAVKALIERIAPQVFVSCSSEVSPRMGEYPRTVATVVNAYIGPLMRSYVGEIAERAHQLGFPGNVLFAQAIGGAMPTTTARALPLLTLDSGPVSGVIGSSVLGPRLGYDNIITTDMGGTTFDVGIIQAGKPLMRNTTVVDQYEMYLPMVDVVSIGAGGGSIAWIDPASGTMRVGPRSAGSSPGPICYGRGGQAPTVTDANLVMGILDPEFFLGGRERLDLEAARRGIAVLGGQLGLSVDETATGILRIVDHSMANEIRRMSVYKGLDPRDMVIFAFGGAGPMHATSYGRELGVREVVIPLGDAAAAWSALGALAGDITHVFDQSLYLREPLDMRELAAVFRKLEGAGEAWLADQGFQTHEMAFERIVGMKYGAQVQDLEVLVSPEFLHGDAGAQALAERFEAAYAARFGKGSGYREAGIEILRQRVTARGKSPALVLRPAARENDPTTLVNPGDGIATALKGTRRVYWPELRHAEATRVVDGNALQPEMVAAGPLIVELPYTTVPIRPGQTLRLDANGSLVISVA